jgi:uracil DNA glycosylase
MSDANTPATPGPSDPLALAELFEGGGEAWLPLLKPVIEAQPDAAAFIGPGRGPDVVPVRELTFQALKPHAPHRWKVVVFGQNPYPRPESATGIAMFDNTFHDWKDSQFGRVVSIRCIIKAAAMWKYGIPKKTPIADVRALLRKQDTVQPPEWFQAMLTQGVLLLNAALTASADGALGPDRHTAFWRPVAERIVEEILSAKQNAAEEDRGVVFAWWGAHARNLKKVVLRLQKKYPDVDVRHIDHPNPAAQGDVFCDGDHFAMVNAALASLGADPVDWLPSTGWNTLAEAAGGADGGTAERMGAFIASTMELHQLYLERLASVKDEGLELPPITGVFDTPLMDFRDAAGPVARLLSGLERHIGQSHDFGKRRADGTAEGLSADAIAALHLYTCESACSARRTGRGSSRTCRTCGCCSPRSRSSRPARHRCGAVSRWTCGRSTRSDGPSPGGACPRARRSSVWRRRSSAVAAGGPSSRSIRCGPRASSSSRRSPARRSSSCCRARSSR